MHIKQKFSFCRNHSLLSLVKLKWISYVFFIAIPSCVDKVNALKRGTNELSNNLYVIVPRSNFSCNGRITGYMVSLNQNDGGKKNGECDFPSILVWHP